MRSFSVCFPVVCTGFMSAMAVRVCTASELRGTEYELYES